MEHSLLLALSHMNEENEVRFGCYMALALLLAGLLVLRVWRRYWDPSLTVTFFDVGQGDAALVQFPRGKTLLVDGGGGYGNWNAGARVVFPELARLGILHLNYALMSHPDNDHARGFTGIFQDLSLDEFWLNAAFTRVPNPLLREIEKSAMAHSIKEHAFETETHLEVNGAHLTLYPVNEGESGSQTNNRTLVLLLHFAGCKILFTGDIEKEAEQKLVASNLGAIELLKVPHHGSKTSSTPGFLKQIKPRWAVVSVGLRNRYGHPRSEVLERYQSMGTEVFRTDFHGAIRFKITPDGEVHCETAGASCGHTRCGY